MRNYYLSQDSMASTFAMQTRVPPLPLYCYHYYFCSYYYWSCCLGSCNVCKVSASIYMWRAAFNQASTEVVHTHQTQKILLLLQQRRRRQHVLLCTIFPSPSCTQNGQDLWLTDVSVYPQTVCVFACQGKTLHISSRGWLQICAAMLKLAHYMKDLSRNVLRDNLRIILKYNGIIV